MRKSLFSLASLLFATVGCLAPRQVHAQFIGTVGLQTVTNQTTITCTGTQQTFNISNLGQTSHYATFANTGGTTPTFNNFNMAGSNDGSIFYNISNIATQTLSGSVQGSGYYAVVRLQISCTSGAIYRLNYTGSNATAGAPVGANLATQLEQVISFGGSAGSTTTGIFQTPFGSSSGGIFFSYQGGAGPANSTILVQCTFPSNVSANAGIQFGPFTLQTTSNSAQYFPIPTGPCGNVFVTYTAGGASANTINLAYEFNPPGHSSAAQLFTHITGTTATVVKATTGWLHTLSINLGGAGTVSVFDLASASCTGTPATNQVAIITATATTLQTFTYDVNLLNGICVKASAAMDITVSAQ
jgi:hypothetical protein